MSSQVKTALHAALLRLLDPLVRLMMKAGIGAGEFHALVKTAYVRAAREEGGARAANSRIAVQTGLTRKEVSAILKADEDTVLPNTRGSHRAERVLTGWWNDLRFQEEDGTPRALPLRGVVSIEALAAAYGGERRAGGLVLDELMRARAVRERNDGRYEPISRTFAPLNWTVESIAAVGETTRDLIATLVHNMEHASRPHYIRRVVNERVDPQFVPLLIRDIQGYADNLCTSIDDELNSGRVTLKPAAKAQSARRIGLVMFLLEEPSTTESLG